LTLEQLPPSVRALLERARVAHLGLIDDDGAPRVLPITYALHEGALWSAIDDKPKRAAAPARLRWLRARPRAAATVDRYDDDWTRLEWVQLLGAVSIRAVADEPGALAALAARYGDYAERRPAGPLLRLEPERALWWSAAGEAGST
jgi:PPOX class probable F420-dependent enzyme